MDIQSPPGFLGSSEMADCMQAQSGPSLEDLEPELTAKLRALHIVEVQ